jgi:hypothetical protein
MAAPAEPASRVRLQVSARGCTPFVYIELDNAASLQLFNAMKFVDVGRVRCCSRAHPHPGYSMTGLMQQADWLLVNLKPH